jgi:hypothetical protein
MIKKSESDLFPFNGNENFLWNQTLDDSSLPSRDSAFFQAFSHENITIQTSHVFQLPEDVP